MTTPIVKIGPEVCRPHYAAAAQDLRVFRPPSFCLKAADAIAQAKGIIDSKTAREIHCDKIAFLKSEIFNEADHNKIMALQAALLKEQIFKPDNYNVTPVYYIPVETARRIIFEGKKPSGVQLASGYSFYPLFLKEYDGLANFWGIDSDPAAVAFARQIGAPVIDADVRQLPFENGELDLVVSHHLLDTSYTSFIDMLGRLNGEAAAFIPTVMKEANRVLRPGGWFLTQAEVNSIGELRTSWPGKIAQITTFDFGMSVDNLYALQKA